MRTAFDVTREDLNASPAYWTQTLQLEVFKMVNSYLKSTGMTRSQFAERLGVSKGYVSQIMNGDFDHKLSKLVELILACDKIPVISFVPKERAEEVAHRAYTLPSSWRNYKFEPFTTRMGSASEASVTFTSSNFEITAA